MGPTVKGLLGQLSTEEMSQVVPAIFTDFNWADIKREVARLKLRKTSKDLAVVSAKLFQDTQPNSEVVQEAVWVLQLFIAAMKKKRIWFCHQLVDQRDPVYISSASDFLASVIESFKSQLLDIEVRSVMLGDVIWSVSLVKHTKKNGGVRFEPIVYSAYKPNVQVPHIFLSPKSIAYPELYAGALGFSSLEYTCLYGRDVAGMFKMVERKHTLNLQYDLPNYTPRDVFSDTRGIRAHSEEYASKLLRGDTPLYQLTVKSKSKWRGVQYIPSEVLDNADDGEVTFQLGFVSSSPRYTVEDVVRHMIAIGVIASPPPVFIQRLGTIAKNYITLKSKSIQQ
ncbi:hypothetical protein AAG570_001528 [Ranatra chinensis]|uniref:Uncharacterized protein n=1 Tax=Ranatra chinensis TaxID=642074 RepID=A0ABD0Y8S4_9HEMI